MVWSRSAVWGLRWPPTVVTSMMEVACRCPACKPCLRLGERRCPGSMFGPAAAPQAVDNPVAWERVFPATLPHLHPQLHLRQAHQFSPAGRLTHGQGWGKQKAFHDLCVELDMINQMDSPSVRGNLGWFPLERRCACTLMIQFPLYWRPSEVGWWKRPWKMTVENITVETKSILCYPSLIMDGHNKASRIFDLFFGRFGIIFLNLAINQRGAFKGNLNPLQEGKLGQLNPENWNIFASSISTSKLQLAEYIRFFKWFKSSNNCSQSAQKPFAGALGSWGINLDTCIGGESVLNGENVRHGWVMCFQEAEKVVNFGPFGLKEETRKEAKQPTPRPIKNWIKQAIKVVSSFPSFLH